MSSAKQYGNITVRFEREFLARLNHLEALVSLNRSDITREALNAVLRQFERTGKLSFPFEIGDVALGAYEKAVGRCGELEGRLLAIAEKVESMELLASRSDFELGVMREMLAGEREKSNALERLIMGLEAKHDAYKAELAEAAKAEAIATERVRQMEGQLQKMEAELRERNSIS